MRFGAVDGPGPGESVTVEIAVTSYHRNVSLVASLPGGGFAGFHRLRPSGRLGLPALHDVLAWEAGGYRAGPPLAAEPDRPGVDPL